MKSLLKLPLPICGLALGYAALANLLASYHIFLRYFFSGISLMIILAVGLSFVCFFKERKQQLQNSVIASVFGTFFMAITLLSTIFYQISPNLGLGLWLVGVIGHLSYAIYFTVKHVLPFNYEKALPSWFIVYVGYVVGANTSKVFHFETIGRYFVILGFAFFVLIFMINALRVVKKKGLDKSIKPLNIIYTAPLNLCIIGYLTVFKPINNYFLISVLTISVIIFILSLIYLFKLPKKVFHPSFSAFTFPIVITTTAYKLCIKHLNLNLTYGIMFLELLSLMLILYVSYGYLRMLYASK